MENKNKTTQYAHEKAVFEWTAPDYIHYEKDSRWFMVAGLIVAGLIVYGIIWGSAFFSIAIGVLSAVYYLQHQKPPRQVKIILSEMGFKRDDKFYPFSSLRSFWIVYDPPEVTTLHFRSVKNINTEIVIQLENEDPAPIREFLTRQLPEEEGKGESFMNMLVRMFRL